ncbi:DUF4825 domain-containing protein [Sediminibacillus massiliensis]|uniref:DUF4825 domain-containing protein n=1 Tax=Sediminibacillus massiliensis TaxID=1926277 RepID=UPI0009887BA8|nr:DUF4825 domain-containing protein [Sediminibacillus massiliensis]
MNYRKLILPMILALLVITACQEDDPVPTTYSNLDLTSIAKYSGTYVGDNSTVLHLAQTLPGGEAIQELELTNQHLKVTYTTENVSDEEMYSWLYNQDTLQNNLLFNASLLTILVPNAMEYQFETEEFAFSVPRNEMVKRLQEKLEDFPDEEEIWTEATVVEFFDKNKNTIKVLIEAEEFKSNFFEDFPIQKGK